MSSLVDASIGWGGAALLALCLFVALAFEFANGFHDTANAVATVIYTKSLGPRRAVLLSGLFNFAGVMLSSAIGGIAVALGIVKLLPLELLVSHSSGSAVAMVLALLVAAILWNVGTWYFGLPASSSHTLIGAIIGVGLAHSLTAGHHFGEGVNFSKATEIGVSLLVSPLFGFGCAFGLLWLVRRYAKNPALNTPPTGDAPPPVGTRSLLIATSSAVSFAHGMNDGQKGVGLIMLILMGLSPATYALRADAHADALGKTVAACERLERTIDAHADASGAKHAEAVKEQLEAIRGRLAGKASVSDIPASERFAVRESILKADAGIDKLVKAGELGLSDEQKNDLATDRKALRSLTDYAPYGVMLAVALALGVGTTVGWRRVVVTIGEKIGKAHLTYAQGASAELVAASTILLASRFGLPVSTTHVLSSGIAGTMVAQKSGLNTSTVRNIALAWVLTLPVSMLLSGALFLLFRAFVGK